MKLGSMAGAGDICALALVFAVGFSASTAEAQSWEELALVNSAMRLGSSSGSSVGRATFRTRYALDCASLLAQHSDIANVFEDSSAFTASIGEDPYLLGYSAGWLASFSTEYRKVWTPCETVLDSSVRVSLTRRVEECRTIALDLGRQASINPVFALLENHAQGRLFRKEMISLLELGRWEDAWKSVLEAASRQSFSLPCHAALTDGLFQALQEK